MVHEGDEVQLSLEAGGKPSPTLQWFRGSQPMPGQTDAILDILEVHAADAGFYSCEASLVQVPAQCRASCHSAHGVLVQQDTFMADVLLLA